MTTAQSVHLTEEAMNDVLIGLSLPESDAHLAACPVCSGQLEEFRSQMQLFNQTTLAWSEARPGVNLRTGSSRKVYQGIFAPAVWALAATVLLAVGLPIWNHFHRSYRNYAVVLPAAPGDNATQIAEDNDLLRSVNAALNDNEVSPLTEYHLADEPHPRRKARPEVRTQ